LGARGAKLKNANYRRARYNPVFAYASGNITLDLGELTGDTFTGLSDPKVVKAVWQLLELCSLAQVTANDGVAEGERLAAFPNATTGQFDATNNVIPKSRLIYVENKIDPTFVDGQTN
jgi:hypothetical protein